MIKIYDCSNSNERPKNRENGCPVQNDIVKYLKENAYKYNCKFVDIPDISDVIFTNDVFPKQIQEINKPKIKRMDGIFWQNKYLDRNKLLNQSAQIANHVIFISEFSKDSYFKLYGNPLKSYSVCLNQVDSNIFYNQDKNIDDLIFVATASSWSRKEKRSYEIIQFADMIEERIILIGYPPNAILPDNCISVGYIENPEIICDTLNQGTAFVNFSYRDAAPKTVCQALCCGLPVLYANSGGVPEIVESYGVLIEDEVKKILKIIFLI